MSIKPYFESKHCVLYLGDCLEILPELGKVDEIITDPPYKYLKQQRLDRDFDEVSFFGECKRVLKENGKIVLFGRGSSFYRWNTRLEELGFKFLEEIVWNKIYGSSPVTPITRVHETISIHSRAGSIKTSFVPYVEAKHDNLPSIHQDLRRIKSALKNTDEFRDLETFLKTGYVNYLDHNRTLGCNTTVQTAMAQQSRGVKTMQMITRGMKEKSIINSPRAHFTTSHPTQKPTRLIERLLALISDPRDVVLDPFMGSGSTGIACLNIARQFIGIEIDEEYCEIAAKRIERAEIDAAQNLFLEPELVIPEVIPEKQMELTL